MLEHVQPSADAFLLMIDSLHRQMFELLENYLRHKSDMVNYEAARVICEMRNVTTAELSRPIAGQ